jgi:hypothetical protein
MKKEVSIRRKAAFLLILGTFFFTLVPFSGAYAGAWGEETGLLNVEKIIDRIQKSIEGALLGIYKSTAITLLNTRTMGLVAGSSSKTSKIITNWKDTLYDEPERNVEAAMENYYAATLRGRDSGSGSEYYRYLRESAEGRYTTSARVADSVNRIGEITTDPIAALQEGDLRVFSGLLASGADPFGYSLAAEEYRWALRERYRREAEVQAIAYGGYKGVRDDDGNVILPGSTVGDIVANTEDAGRKIIAAAQNPAELIGNVVVALANRMVTNLIQNGVGEIQSTINKEIRNVDRQVMSTVTSANRSLGESYQYSNDTRMWVDMNVGAAQAGVVPQAIDNVANP